MKKSDKKTIGQEVEAYDDKHKKVRMRNISLGIMAAVVCVGVGLGLRLYGHAVTNGDVDGLVVETLAEGGATVSSGNAAAVTELTYLQTSRKYTDGSVTFALSYTADAMIPDQAEMTVEKYSDNIYGVTFLYNDKEITPAQALDVKVTLADGKVYTAQTADLSALEINKMTLQVTRASAEGEVTFDETTKVYEDDEVRITATYSEDAVIPDQAELKARKLTGGELTEYMASAQAELADGAQMIEGLTVAYDITFEYNGTEFEPEDSVNVKMTFKDGTFDDVDDLTVVHLGEEQTDVFNDVTVEDGEASVDLGSFSVTVWTVEGMDISGYVTDVSFQELNSASQFQDVDDNKVYTATEEAQLAFSFENVNLKNSDGSIEKTAYVQLSGNLLDYIKELDADDVTCTFENVGYTGTAGTFTIVTDNNGNCYAVFTFYDDFLKWYSTSTDNIIKGTAGFRFTWDKTKISTAGNTVTVTIGEKSDTVTVKTEDTSKASTYTITKKDSSSADYDNEKGEVTIHWTIKVEVKNAAWTNGQIVITDAPYLGKNIKLTEWKATGSGENGSTKPTSEADPDYVTQNGNTITLGDSSGVLPYTYEIYYDTTYAAAELKGLEVVKNSITWNGGSDEGEKYVNKTVVSKSGTTVNNDAYDTDGTIEWTVTVNGGPNDYYYLTNETFEDAIPDQNVLLSSNGETASEGDTTGITIMRYEAGSSNGTNVTGSSSVTYQNGKITAVLNKANDDSDNGFYKYVITYKTKDVSDRTGTFNVSNTATVDGDITGEYTANPEVKKPTTTKYAGAVTLVDSDKQIYNLPWTVYINGGVSAGEEHTDSVYVWDNSGKVDASKITLDSITVTSKDGTTTYGANEYYTIVTGDVEALAGQLQQSSDAVGVFKIVFNKLIAEDIKISYNFRLDASEVNGGFAMKNFFDLISKTNDWNNKWQETGSLNKYATTTDLGLSRTIGWKIEAEPKKIVTEDLKFKDTIQTGLKFDEGTLVIQIAFDDNKGWYEITSDDFEEKKYYDYSYDEATGELEITLKLLDDHIYKEANKGVTESWAYSDASVSKLTNVVITYNTTITEEWLDDTTSKTYKNTVKWDGYTRVAEATVKREVIGKNVSYDASTYTLSYTVIVNPDGSKLADGDLLTLTDTFYDKGTNIELTSVTLYNLKDGEASEPMDPGLTKLEDGEDPSAYTYTTDPDGSNDTQIITAYLPDKTPCALVYTYTLTGSLGKNVTYKNKAVLTGNGKSYSKEKSEEVKAVTVYAETDTGNLGSVVLVKRDADSYKKTLADAEFTLYKWVPGSTDDVAGSWETVSTYTTLANGIAQFSGLNPDTLYRISETETPADYGLVEGWENQYIAFANEGDDGKLSTGTIDELVEDANADGAGIDADSNLQIVDLTASKTCTYRYDRWPNERGKTSIKIEKLWKDASGNATTRNDAEKLKVDLYRVAVAYEAGKTNVCAPDEVANLNGITTPEAYANYKATAQATGNYVGNYEIPFTNGGWSLTINNLDKFADEEATQMYQYYVVESECVPDSTNTVTAVAYAIPGNASKDTIQVTNTLSASYSLPETGGAGTLLERIICWFKSLFSL